MSQLSNETKHQITDYVRPHFFVPRTDLMFDVYETHTIVRARYHVRPENLESFQDLVLNGSDSIESVVVRCGKIEVPHIINIENEEHNLVIDKDVVKDLLRNSDSFVLDVECKIFPDKNTELSGLYVSNGTYCTQCESHGFRRIVFSFDRPDVLSCYTVTIMSDHEKYPVVLSNGNMIRSEYDPETLRRVTVWSDPHPKPSYLFAMVVGNLGYIESDYLIQNNLMTKVTLRIYAQHHKLNQLDLAMESLKKAMRWDEEKFGLCYDLSLFNIVCLDDFNAGAMENKGLNIFNSKYVLATPQTATDMDCESITGVIGHEYFHNWTGNRVTLEKWFDLTLKEGLTVYRDQTFSRDIGTSPVRHTIDRAIDLRNGQFIEDSGPNAHPIRPRSYDVMDNFYTSTVYDKGAEIIRIYETLLGVQGFRKGMDLYFKRHDGTAVACEDFWKAMFDANTMTEQEIEKNTVPMQRLFNWYHQAGTPRVSIEYQWNPETHTMNISCKQSILHTESKNDQQPYDPVLIPIKMGLVNKMGTKVCPTNVTVTDDSDGSFILNLCELEQEFVLTGIDSLCVPSFMRDFSAPVVTNYHMSLGTRLFLMKSDPNQFNRWEQSQFIHKHFMCGIYNNHTNVSDIEQYMEIMTQIVHDEDMDIYLKAYMLNLPLQDDMYSVIPSCDPILLHGVTGKIYGMIAQRTMDYLEKTTTRLMSQLSHSQVSERELLRTIMKIRMSHHDQNVMNYVHQIKNYFEQSTNFTDQTNCINVLSQASDPELQIYEILHQMLDSMAEQYVGDSLMSAKWLRFMSKITSPQTVDVLTRLYTGHHKHSKMINKTTPNHLYALVSAFTVNPYVHQIINIDGKDHAPGYLYITDCVIDIDMTNPQVAACIAGFFESIKSLSPVHQKCMREYIDHILSRPTLSKNVKEILSSC
jgi:aminopeptidase N